MTSAFDDIFGGFGKSRAQLAYEKLHEAMRLEAFRHDARVAGFNFCRAKCAGLARETGDEALAVRIEALELKRKP